jgi:hypothetical protein
MASAKRPLSREGEYPKVREEGTELASEGDYLRNLNRGGAEEGNGEWAMGSGGARGGCEARIMGHATRGTKHARHECRIADAEWR